MPDATRVIVWQNGMVLVFDAAGEQVPECQGALAAVRERLAAVVPPERWEYATWPGVEPLPPKARRKAIASAATRIEAASIAGYWEATDPARADVYAREAARWRP